MFPYVIQQLNHQTMEVDTVFGTSSSYSAMVEDIQNHIAEKMHEHYMQIYDECYGEEDIVIELPYNYDGFCVLYWWNKSCSYDKIKWWRNIFKVDYCLEEGGWRELDIENDKKMIFEKFERLFEKK
jgi:hypothetical protein